MPSTHENATIRAWVDAALALLLSWADWPGLRAETATTVLMLEIEAEQLWTQVIDDGRDPTSMGQAAANSIAIMAVHWWATEGRTLRDVERRR